MIFVVVEETFSHKTYHVVTSNRFFFYCILIFDRFFVVETNVFIAYH